MTPEQIANRIVEIYTMVAPGGVAPKPGEDGQLDSMAFLEFISEIECVFGIEIDLEDVTEEIFQSASATAEYVASRVS